MKRKTFIFLTVAGAAALATPTAGCRHYSDTLVNTLGHPLFLRLICDAKTLAEIGTAYRAAVPAEAHKDDLIDLLLKDLPSTGREDHLLPHLLNTRAGQDFIANNTIIIKGWVLSRTEARQCAIYSLSLK